MPVDIIAQVIERAILSLSDGKDRSEDLQAIRTLAKEAGEQICEELIASQSGGIIVFGTDALMRAIMALEETTEDDRSFLSTLEPKALHISAYCRPISGDKYSIGLWLTLKEGYQQIDCVVPRKDIGNFMRECSVLYEHPIRSGST